MSELDQATATNLFENPEINFCTCGCEAKLHTHVRSAVHPGFRGHKKRVQYYVSCLDQQCQNRGKTAYTEAQAVLVWNGSEHSDFPEYFDLPFLHLQGMLVEEVQAMLLEERKVALQEIENHRGLGSKPGAYSTIEKQRLRVAWIDYGLSWLYKLNPGLLSASEDEQVFA